ncbi:MAG: RNA polymerase sigma-70 factor [Bacteroidetes bacterium]|jgi:RNA polymerase sigma-70 factor (ECF subfamily)|nr:RNA polymerase sigma-70 factor [Bacteroidota bacterium]
MPDQRVDIAFSEIAQGNKRAFEQLFRQYYKPLVAYAHVVLAHRETAEDLVQEVFYQLWARRQELRVDGHIKSYLYSMVRNRALNHQAHLKVVARHQQWATEDEGDTHDPVETEEMASRLENAVALLPPERKKIFYLCKYEEKKYREIADEMGISVKTVENQMGKALKFLRAQLADIFVTTFFFYILALSQWG